MCCLCALWGSLLCLAGRTVCGLGEKANELVSGPQNCGALSRPFSTSPYTPTIPPLLSNQGRSCPLLPTAPPNSWEERGVISMGHCPQIMGPSCRLKEETKRPPLHTHYPLVKSLLLDYSPNVLIQRLEGGGGGGESGWGMLKHLSTCSPSPPLPHPAVCPPPSLSGKWPSSLSPDSELSYSPWTIPKAAEHATHHGP